MPDDLHFTQNFLHSTTLVARLIELADLTPSDAVLEIGPGEGIITHALAERVAQVTAVELDATLAARLRTRFAEAPQVTIHHGDILQFALSTLPDGYRVVANVPFAITSDLLDHLLTGPAAPQHAHLILQTETLISRSKWGDGETFKALLIKPRYTLTQAHTFSPADFTPRPSVETAFFAFHQRPQPLVTPADYPLYKDFLAFVSPDRVGEGAWRKVFAKGALADIPGLTVGRGLKSQTVEGITAAFHRFRTNKKAHRIVHGALDDLRAQQAHRRRINKKGGHHRSNRRR